MRTVQLGNVCEFVRGVTFPSGEGKTGPMGNSIACLTTSGVQEEVAWQSCRFIPRDRVGNDRQILRSGDILISTANSKELVGKSCIVHGSPFPCTFGAFVTVARPQEGVYPPYLAYWMGTPEFLAWCFRTSSNTTNISNLRVSELAKIEFPLPDLSEQKGVAELLEQADRLRRTRRYALEISDTFLPAVFLERFGDPLHNQKGFTTRRVGELCDLVRGSSPRPQGDPRFFRGPIPRLMIADITRDGVYVTPQIDSLTEEGARRSRPMDKGSVVMAVSGDVGLPAILARDACIHDGFVGYRDLSSDLLPLYFYYNLKARQVFSYGQATGAIWQNITTDQIKTWAIPVPPMATQQRFAALVSRHERVCANRRESLRQADHLFQYLLHKAFAQRA